MSKTHIPITKGSDLNFSIKFTEETGGPLDLTGYTSEVYDPHASIGAGLVFTIDDPASGLINARLEWENTNNGLPLGAVASFRVKISKDGDDLTSPEMVFQVI